MYTMLNMSNMFKHEIHFYSTSHYNLCIYMIQEIYLNIIMK